MLTLGTMGAIGAYATSGGSAKKDQGPPINASSKEEEQFIQYAEMIQSINTVEHADETQRIYQGCERGRRKSKTLSII